MTKQVEKKDNFSVALGLFDYINPIFYTITTITILGNMKEMMSSSFYSVYLIGAIISIIFGFAIPTVKFIVGLGIMPFKMPVNLVFYVNSGIFISGFCLFHEVMSIPSVLTIVLVILAIGFLFMLYQKTKKFNTIAVLTGAVGYLLIYISLICLAINRSMTVCIFLYALAILLFVSLCFIGIKGNLKDARVHWVIEICNVICQGSVALSTILLFH